jgi:hypothetical protein
VISVEKVAATELAGMTDEIFDHIRD